MPLLMRVFLVNVTNPKGLVFLIAVLPQFVVPSTPLRRQNLVIGVTMVAVDLVVMGLYPGLAARAAGLPAHRPAAGGAQPGVVRPVCDRRAGAVAGARGRVRVTRRYLRM